MAFFDTTWYCNYGNGSSTGYYAVPQFAASHAYNAGDLIRQLTAPVVGNERVFVCIVAGTSGAEPAWTVTRGARNTSTTPVFQECTGASAVNGDLTNTPNWTTVKNLAVTLGAIIKRNNSASYQICSTAGTASNGAEPSFSDTAGVTTSDGTVTWTSLGVVGNFTGGQAPHARLANACANTWTASGNTINISSASAETQAAVLTLTFGANIGTQTAPIKIICVNFSNFPPQSGDVTSGASVTTTGNSSLNLQPNAWHVKGVTFSCGSGAVGVVFAVGAANSLYQVYDNCSFQIPGTTAGSIRFGNATNTAASVVMLNNTTVKFGNTGSSITSYFSQFSWRNTGQILVAGSSVPSVLFNPIGSSGIFNNVLFEGLDLSQLTGNIFSSSGQAQVGNFVVKDCKLNASTVKTISAVNRGWQVDLLRCDSGATNYISERHSYLADETTETTITRVGGATTPDSQQQTRKIVTTANNILWFDPYIMEALAVWNPTTGSNVTVTIEGTINAGAVPNNDDIWIEVVYLGNSGSPLGIFANDTKANLLASGSALTSSGSTWNGGGSGAGWSPFKLAVTLSSPQPQLTGLIFVYVKMAKASTTYYIDPLPVLS